MDSLKSKSSAGMIQKTKFKTKAGYKMDTLFTFLLVKLMLQTFAQKMSFDLLTNKKRYIWLG